MMEVEPELGVGGVVDKPLVLSFVLLVNYQGLNLDTGPVQSVCVSTDIDLVTRMKSSVKHRGTCDLRRPLVSNDSVKQNTSVTSSIKPGISCETTADPELLPWSDVIPKIPTDDCSSLSIPSDGGRQSRNKLHCPVSANSSHISNSGELIELLTHSQRALLVAEQSSAGTVVTEHEASLQSGTASADSGVLGLGRGSSQARVSDCDRVNISTSRREGETIAHSRVLHEPNVPLEATKRSIGSNCLASPATTLATRVLSPNNVNGANSRHLFQLVLHPLSSLIEKDASRSSGARIIDRECARKTCTSLLTLSDSRDSYSSQNVSLLSNNEDGNVTSTRGSLSSIVDEGDHPLNDTILVDDSPGNIDPSESARVLQVPLNALAGVNPASIKGPLSRSVPSQLVIEIGIKVSWVLESGRQSLGNI
mmetsp:Transcript_19171/g.39524  ORF Transcript_19171/g.39524 Transcript_19171/m.39524 type:complete len:422 (+) Transcript_19171:3773-5038(+)